MKLDRIKFATLISFITYRAKFTLSQDDITEIDTITEMNVEPVEVPGKADPAKLNELMRAIHAGEMIAAIKAYRDMTSCSLKEVKDAVEKDWIDKKAELCNAMINSINDQLSGVPLTDRVLEKFNYDQLKLVKEFINSFY